MTFFAASPLASASLTCSLERLSGETEFFLALEEEGTPLDGLDDIGCCCCCCCGPCGGGGGDGEEDRPDGVCACLIAWERCRKLYGKLREED